MQPKVRPLNPDHQRLIEDLLANPSTVMCPICGERGFWDNRENKKNPKSPDWKCKNKACVGATPMKGKNPYAVWLPEGFTDAPAPASKRVPPPDTRSTGQKEFDAAVPPDEETGAPPKGATDAPAPLTAAERLAEKTEAYFALARSVAAFQRELSTAHEAPFDMASVNAMTYSIWASR